jgi:signal transduction histidine kinase/CheY-like chemotaxis protein
MFHLPAIPRDPPARLRLMSLWFVMFAVAIDVIAITTGRLATPTARVVGVAAVVALMAWVLWGYRRQRFPEWSTPVEAVLLVACTAGSSLPLRSMGLYLALVIFRALYVTRREFWLLPASYGVARVAGLALTPQPAPYDAVSVTVLLQFIGIAIIGGILFMLMQALEGQARAESHLRDAQKMEAVGQLAGGIAHDFNNLLTVIGGHAYMIERLGEPTPAAAKHIAGINQTIERAGSLTRQLLAFGRRQLLNPAVLDLTAAVRGAAQLLEPVVGERIRVITDFDPSSPHIRADAGQLEQVLLNLGLNARDAMPDGGTLRIATRTLGAPSDAQVCVIFEDSGTGMDGDTAAHVFEPFFTTKRGGRGTGLGLATAYGIVKQSGGDITVTTAPGKGSTFTITLPTVPRPDIDPDRDFADVTVGPGALSVRRVLLVEDSDGVREFVRSVLVNSGAAVTLAVDGAEGLAIVRSGAESFDLIVTDIVMPRLGGPQMAAGLRDLHPELPVLYMTGYADNALSRDQLDSGHEALIQKPFSANALLDAINALSATPTSTSA